MSLGCGMFHLARWLSVPVVHYHDLRVGLRALTLAMRPKHTSVPVTALIDLVCSTRWLTCHRCQIWCHGGRAVWLVASNVVNARESCTIARTSRLAVRRGCVRGRLHTSGPVGCSPRNQAPWGAAVRGEIASRGFMLHNLLSIIYAKN